MYTFTEFNTLTVTYTYIITCIIYLILFDQRCKVGKMIKKKGSIFCQFCQFRKESKD